MLVDLFGDRIVKYCGAYSYSNNYGDQFTYEIVKVVIPVGDTAHYCYRLYGYHGFTLDCASKGFFINGVDAQNFLEDEAKACLRGMAIESELLTYWERSILREDHERLDNWNF